MKKFALISVSDKRNIIEFAKGLEKLGYTICSSGGTHKTLIESDIEALKVSEVTGFPEILNGRVKTLHPKIHGGILADLRNENHLKQLKEHEITPFSIVCVNLYPFRETVKSGADEDTIIENIDIGGPTLIRSAAKNFQSVAVLVDPDDYKTILDMLNDNGEISAIERKTLALKAFSHTASYDIAISNYFNKSMDIVFPENKFFQFNKQQNLRYGENPHQKACFYSESDFNSSELPALKQLQGKELSYNNIMDTDAAVNMVREFNMPAAVIVKHANPCGIGVDDNSLLMAFRKAHKTDEQSSFGGIIALNREVDIDLAEIISKLFVEVVIAPSFSKEAVIEFSKKKNLRIIELPLVSENYTYIEMKRIRGGILLQDSDTISDNEESWEVVTDCKPDEKLMNALNFAWKVVKHVKSNAIVFCNEQETVAIGAGQMSRVDSVKIAVTKAVKEISGSVLASDAFFPFRDSIDEAAGYGVKAIIQPGGSIRDKEVIEAANKHGIPMVFTGKRHFRH